MLQRITFVGIGLIFLISLFIASTDTLDDLIVQSGAALAQLQSPQADVGGKVLGATTVCPNLTRDLSFDSRGADVMQLQQFLISQNILAVGNATGYFGRLTKAAVIQFQIQQSLLSNGFVGPLTRAAIARVCANSGSDANVSDTVIETFIPIATSCTGSGQLCTPIFTIQVTTASVLKVDFHVPQNFCSSGRLHLFVDGVEKKISSWLGWYGATGSFASLPLDTGSLDLGAVSSGTHALGVQMEGQTGACNQGYLSYWSGNLKVTTSSSVFSNIIFFATPTSGTAPFTVTFSALNLAKGKYYIDFGDGTDAQMQTVFCNGCNNGGGSYSGSSSHAYTATGTRIAKLSYAPQCTTGTSCTQELQQIATSTITSIQSSATKLITSTHRYDPGKMFGGWGSHLGHLLRGSDGTLWFADDTGNDVNKNPAIAYYHIVNNQWIAAGTQPTYGTVQQNMGSIMLGDYIYSYGIDIENHRVEECYFSTILDYGACNHLPFDAGISANYIGAAVTPSGYRLVWWTNVVNGGNGKFSYIYNNGGGWNGPFVSGVGGYNDASYVNITFEDDSIFHMVAEGVLGLAPNWSFTELYTQGVIGQPVTWTVLPGGSFGPIGFGGDLWLDAAKGLHILSRTVKDGLGDLFLYSYKAKGGALQNPTFSLPGAEAARFISSSDEKLYLIYTLASGEIKYRAISKSAISGSIPWSSVGEQLASVPSDLGSMVIYPESQIYQTAPVRGVNFAVNGTKQEENVYHVVTADGNPLLPTSCTFNNQTVLNGQSVTAYQSATVPTGQTCISEVRLCTNETLSGSYANISCSVQTSNPTVSLATSASTYTQDGSNIIVSWSNSAGALTTDWIGIVTGNGPWGSVPAVGDGKTWVWATTNTQTQGSIGGATQGLATFAPLMSLGQYQLVYFLNQKDTNGNYIEKARGAVFTVQ